MTRDEILQAPAGISLDWHVARFVMKAPTEELTPDNCRCAYCGLQMRYCGARSWCSECHEWRHVSFKEYSDDFISAWEVLEKIAEKWDFALLNNQNFREFPNEHFGVRLQAIDEKSHIKTIFALGDTASLAICRAALLTVMDEMA